MAREYDYCLRLWNVKLNYKKIYINHKFEIWVLGLYFVPSLIFVFSAFFSVLVFIT